ncbi:hypothetical protein SAMN05421780_11057 [Flexibacter flexilis DSM 6793]|uniref:Uncharacterized protein n=1 Tax=Flexibacter flexilis DSM 6793 TaxID=927664 RepID=A0A1I1MDH2_9BACT|nr:hypothetical protein [Flexibacter flexilis]SFC81138.1 hypothetical protein SAMN05421780_11057 [Flexibacter flexilis DSM 6793]
MELTHSFQAPTEYRSDITFELKKGGIFDRATMYKSDRKTSLGVTVVQIFGNTGSESSITIPIDEVNNFCKELQQFSEKLKLIET